MQNETKISSVALVGNYLPRKCGIATFTTDLYHAVADQYPGAACSVVSVDDIEGGYDYPPEVRFQIQEQDASGYQRVADFLNLSDVDVVSLQHEFGIYGGVAGNYILELLRGLRVPVVTTLHTVLRAPNPEQLHVMQRIARRSSRLVVMSGRGKYFLQETYGIPAEQVDVIPHGIPDMPFVDPNFFKDQFGVAGKNVLLTFGLLSPNKGIEYVLQALPTVLGRYPDTVYIVLGATHPNLVRDQGEQYRESLERMTVDLGIQDQVIFLNRFAAKSELIEILGAADLYITPYLNPAQITSGPLSYAFGCGKAVISTPYWHAEELLADGRGVLVPFRDHEAMAAEICGLLGDPTKQHAMRKRAYLQGREMVWSNTAHLYLSSFRRARRSYSEAARRAPNIRLLENQAWELPTLTLDHMLHLTDTTGIFQHATYAFPNFAEGYCTDDNARALMLTVLLEEMRQDSQPVRRAAPAYAAFLNYAFDRESGRFRNFLGFDRRWLEETGSDDSLGRAIWALGMCVGRSKRPSLQSWSIELFERALQAVMDTASPRTWAFALLGLHEYLRRFSGDRLANQLRATLTERLLDLYRRAASDDWPWFEDTVTYSNARLPHALILSGRWTSNEEALATGLHALRWLTEVQRSPCGYFRPIGTAGFFSRASEPAVFDQQPVEAGTMVSACLEAYRTTGDDYWMDEARRAYEWFLGRNELGLPLYDQRTGRCYDGLHEDRVNRNCGAESTLAALTALIDMRTQKRSHPPVDQALAPAPHRRATPI